MLKTLKFSGNETDFFFVSDLHWGHNRDFIYTKRKGLDGNYYKSVGEHDSGVIQSWNSTCTNNSIVFNLGDVVFGDPDGSKFLQLMRRLNFKECWVCFGNHVSGQRQVYLKALKDSFPNAFSYDDTGKETLDYEVYPLKIQIDNNPNKTVIFLPQYAEIQINSTPVVISHYPIASFNNMSRAGYCISGHVHNNYALTHPNTGVGLQLDVGLESFGRPISLKEIKYHLRNRNIDAPDHHGKSE
jgi:calcineurin-like phosphoesterase family protein